MAVYNGEKTIRKTLDSIIAQTFHDWELIIINDHSQDNTDAIIEEYSNNDSRIKIRKNTKNEGLAACLNIAIKNSAGDLIARADADDIYHPERLQKQINFLQVNQDIDVLGTAAWLINSEGVRINKVIPRETHEEIAATNIFKLYFFHSSVVIRKRFFEKVGLYDMSLRRSQDIDLWIRGINSGCRFANLPEPLIDYSTNDYKYSWASIYQRIKALLIIAGKKNTRVPKTSILLFALQSVLIKLGIYVPRSLKQYKK